MALRAAAALISSIASSKVNEREEKKLISPLGLRASGRYRSAPSRSWAIVTPTTFLRDG